MPRYQYATYNPGQYPGEVQANLDAMTAAGWHIHTAQCNYSELYVLWERDGSGLVMSGELAMRPVPPEVTPEESAAARPEVPEEGTYPGDGPQPGKPPFTGDNPVS